MNSNAAVVDVRRLVEEADARIRPWVLETPVEHSGYLSELIGGEVYLKLDLQQTTGSFKFRGATSKVMSLTEEQLDIGVVTASTGNYALAVGQAMKNRGRRATVYVAETMVPARVEQIESHGIDIVKYGSDPWDAERKARADAAENGLMYVSPYNDPEVVGGQGTCGLEIARQVRDLDTVIAACGGGGLIGGTAGFLKSVNPAVETIAISPQNSPVLYESVRQGKMIEMESEETLADTCAGGIDLDTITFDLCRNYVDEMAVATEDEIADAIRLLFKHHRLVTEGSAALSIAYIVENAERLRGRRVVAVVCGKNVDMNLFKQIVCC
ncbi:MAG: pyridoxal-phosphate dependent enzyme [Acidobacteria bacterium]|nr:pyridoxal-phosphate dependent enzyme [Acidobacteriota bacterium]